jgi:hypothetical protein
MKPLEIVKPGAAITKLMSTGDENQHGIVIAWPDELASEAFHGIAGDFVRAIEPHTEADPASILIQFLVGFGNMVGRSPYFQVEADRHHTNLFAVVVGATAKGRKGISLGQVRRRLGAVDPAWERERVMGGLSSGEGLIWAVRDPIYKHEAIKERGRVVDYQDVMIDPGVDDKRLLALEAEFASTLQVIRREGNNLSPLIRQAWDTGVLRTLTKNSPAVATGAHISAICHVTKQELLRHLESTETANGFANRFVWICARRSKSLADGGQVDEIDWRPFDRRLQAAVDVARVVGRMTRDENARQLWHAIYDKLSEGQPGLLGAVLSRAEAQVLRIACVYALLSTKSVIMPEHLKAALAVWEYSEASARFIFGDALGDPIADEILRALRGSENGLTRTEIRDLFARNKNAQQVVQALVLLQEHALAYFKNETTDGRPAERWFAIRPPIAPVVEPPSAPPGESR